MDDGTYCRLWGFYLKSLNEPLFTFSTVYIDSFFQLDTVADLARLTLLTFLNKSSSRNRENLKISLKTNESEA